MELDQSKLSGTFLIRYKPSFLFSCLCLNALRSDPMTGKNSNLFFIIKRKEKLGPFFHIKYSKLH